MEVGRDVNMRDAQNPHKERQGSVRHMGVGRDVNMRNAPNPHEERQGSV
jgi:hypothetical protein